MEKKKIYSWIIYIYIYIYIIQPHIYIYIYIYYMIQPYIYIYVWIIYNFGFLKAKCKYGFHSSNVLNATGTYLFKKCFQWNIIAEGFRFIPLGLVRLRTFQLSTWGSLVQTLMLVLTRAVEGVTQRCHNCPRRNGWRSTSDVTYRKCADVCREFEES